MSYSCLKNRSFYSNYLSVSLLTGSMLLMGWSSSASAQCSFEHVFIPDWRATDYRKINGRKNNLAYKAWGAANKQLIRLEGISPDKLRQPGLNNLPNPRLISNHVSSQDGNTSNTKKLSDMFWLWGQFLDHDITLVHTDDDRPAYIPVPNGDPVFSNLKELPFHRSTLIKNGPKHPNVLTSYIDGSNIYGSDKKTAQDLRTGKGGKLKMKDGLLPKDFQGIFYLAGDERANEHIGLTAMHTLWVREHNLIADALACKHPRWNDKKIFRETRRIIVAELQSITYNEFLPALLGPKALSDYWGNGTGYDDQLKANISNVFAAGAYRFGHSMLSPNLLRLDQYGQEISHGHVPLREAFFQPGKLEEAGIEPILRGLASQTAQALDPMLVDDVRNFLFQSPEASHGFDLASLNIQRGRDHQLPSYNDVRSALGLARINSFNNKKWKKGFGDRLELAYESPDDIDLWVGALAEKKAGKALVGETLKAIFIEQFSRLRHGDRFWYENETYYEFQDIKKFKKIRLSHIIKRNTNIWNIERNVFKASEIHKWGDLKKSRRSRAAQPTKADKKRRSRRKAIQKANRKGHLG